MDPVFERDGLWGFCDETWADESFGYETEHAARLALRGYADMELRAAGTPEPDTEAARFWKTCGRSWASAERMVAALEGVA